LKQQTAPIRPSFAQEKCEANDKNRPRRNEICMRSALTLILTMCLALILAGAAMAGPQGSGAGVVTGVVIGPDDKPVPHALVTYQSAGGSSPHVAHADAKGRFTISKLRSDVYAVRASGKGVFSAWENVAVKSGKTKAVTLHTVYAKEIPKAYTATRTYENN
jgi:Carboxypeptidase regulatory-like domain